MSSKITVDLCCAQVAQGLLEHAQQQQSDQQDDGGSPEGGGLTHPLVYIEAYATSDYGDSPRFAQVPSTQEFIDQLGRLSGLCDAQNLSEVRVYSHPEAWGPGGVEDEMRLQCGELVVTKTAFWFVDQPKHADYHIESRAVAIDAFVADVMAAKDGSTLYFGDDLDDVIDAIAESLDQTNSEAPLA